MVLVEATVRHGEAKDSAARAKLSTGAGCKPVPPNEPRPDVVALRAKVAEAEAQERLVAAERQASIQKRDNAKAELDRQARAVDTLRRQLEAARAGRCDLCGSATAEELATKLHKEFVTAEFMARDLADKFLAAGIAVPEPYSGGEVPFSEQARRKLAEATGIDAEWRSHDRELASWQARDKAVKAEASGVVTRLATTAEALGEAEDRADELKARVNLLECAQQVLGPRGARARLLADALGGVSQAATAWATRLFGRDVGVELSPSVEQKNGNAVAKLGLAVSGVGNGAYRSLSGGERRRVDVAILLALADVSSAARGEDHGVLWLDEVLDALDDGGIEAVCSVAEELARERCVVLISHSKLLVDALRPTMEVKL
jgi:DNA repair exonuclease SbcCD ATPase subunit